MRTLFHVVSGVLLCLVAVAAIDGIGMMIHPYGAITNKDYSSVHITDTAGYSGTREYELRKGESRLLPYGEYTVFIPDAKASFVLLKNNRGTCTLHSAGGILLVETNRNASIENTAQ